MTTPLRVLVLEGHPAAAELVLSQLRQAGYEATWERVETQAEYLARLEPPPDLILADYRLPRFGAPAALRLLRQRGLDIPFIVVAGRIGELAAVECLKQGADDFLPRDCLGHLGPAVARALERRRFGRAGANEAAMRESNLRLQQALTELQRAQQRIVEQERLRALGQMAGGLFHDFNNALAQVVGYAELLLTRPADLKDHDRSREYLGYILIAARDATAVVERLREFYRAREPGEAHRPIDLNPLVEAVVALTRPRWKDEAQARGAEMRVKTKLAASARVLGDESELREALTNLVFNALDAMPAGGTITIATRDAGNRVVVEVRDTGAGMPPPVRRRCLEPFFTTKGNRGTGLGLSMVHGIMRRHGGEVEVRSAAGRGTTVRLRVPAAARAAPEVGSAPIRLRPGRALSVLVVDDEPRLRDLISRYLAIDGHRVSAAADGARALEQFRAGRFDVLLTDRSMPGMSGDQLAAAVKELAPNTPVIMLTGFGDLMAVGDDRPTGVDRLLSKPLKLGALRQALKDAVAREPGQLAERREERCE